ncbi:unnamed protein product [Rotaria sordida]|uniref:Carrier domain-containing protein n=1 Tax=Rotaria sordida TaxID=392033 RepID=A0A815DSF6_9BILA|nr:unnamed protein product [Rotaria sordida]
MNRLSCEDDSALRYMDYAIIEQQTSMTAASAFWLDSLRDCKIHHHLSLPFDRHRVSDEHRTGRGISASFSFGEHLSRAFIVYASISKTTLENMALASYYAFLFKLANGERDLCIGINTHGRYKPELMSIIGMFVNAIPLRCKLDPSWPFARLVKEVHQIAMDSSHYSYFPLQRILAQHPLVSKPAFLDTSFEFDSNTTQNMSNEIMLDDICLSLVPYSIKIETDEIGELLVGGVGVFAGYLGRDDLTAKALVKINELMYYRTGDLVRMDSSGLIHYIGRKDYQVKLHGQRIEVGEIERCLLDTHIATCIVVKWGNDHLVAYVQGSDINEDDLRNHCRSRLPPFMIPSMFVVLDQLPLNANGKVERQRLPVPDFASLSTSTTISYGAPRTEMEKRVHDLWCKVLQSIDKKISTTAGFFTVGGHSLLFIQLYHHYQSVFGFDSQMLPITPFLQQATIAEHAKLLETIDSLTDPHLVTVGDHVRLNIGAYVQCHTFEQRLLKLAPVTINHSSVLMTYIIINIYSHTNCIRVW